MRRDVFDVALRGVIVVVLGALLATAPLGAVSAAEEKKAGEWIKDEKAACAVWNPNPVPNETITWSGPCRDGQAQGYGVLQWFKDGEPKGRFEGEMAGGKAFGRGIETYFNGDRYEGEFIDGKRTGQGLMIYADGRRYEGQFMKGYREGQGIYTWPDGGSYRGQFRGGWREGVGVSVYSDGGRYQGEFFEGERHGQGNYTYNDGSRYWGGWREGKRFGIGIYINGDRSFRYIGAYWEDERHGRGSCFKPGEAWICYWKNGEQVR